jgi:hypothetical protein
MPIIKHLSRRMGIAFALPILHASMAVSLNGLDHRSGNQVSCRVRWASEPHHLSAVRCGSFLTAPYKSRPSGWPER